MIIKHCGVDNCNGITGVAGTARGLCNAHYHRFMRHGDPLKGGSPKLGYPNNLLTGYLESKNGCWIWEGKPNNSGYGSVYTTYKRQELAHRAMYEYKIDKIPDNLELDHLCRNRLCINPEHLEPVTSLENNRRARIANGLDVKCKRGHLRQDDNWYYHPDGSRECLKCRRIREHKRNP